MSSRSGFHSVLPALGWGYEHLACPLMFLDSPQVSHERILRLLAWMDHHEAMIGVLERTNRALFTSNPVSVGGAVLPHSMILAAGFVKGRGFETEQDALAAVAQGDNIMPGWRSVPALVGAVEFGSFTRWSRMGNSGRVLWRDKASKSLQNRIGLKNPGARAAAAFLGERKPSLPPAFGLNIAPSPGVDDEEQEQREIYEAIDVFVRGGVTPSWFTLNLSCPNTEDDPANRQTESRSRAVCRAALDALANTGIPLWVKISPALAESQYRTLLRVFADAGVRAVVATNTLAQPTPDGAQTVAGVSGGRLHPCAVDVVKLLMDEKRREGYALDIIACGGVQDGETYAAFASMQVRAMQYWSALIYRGPFAAALIEYEARNKGVPVDDRSSD